MQDKVLNFETFTNDLNYSDSGKRAFYMLESIFFHVQFYRLAWNDLTNYIKQEAKPLDIHASMGFFFNEPVVSDCKSEFDYPLEVWIDNNKRTLGWVYGRAICHFQSIIDDYLKAVLLLHVGKNVELEAINKTNGSFQDLFQKTFKSALGKFEKLKEMHILYETRNAVIHNDGIISPQLEKTKKKYNLPKPTKDQVKYLDTPEHIGMSFYEILQVKNDCKEFIASVEKELNVKDIIDN